MDAKETYGPWLVRATLIALLFTLYSLSEARAEAQPQLTEGDYPADVETLFAPQQFDDDDFSEVVLDGWLQSSCDRLQDPKIEVLHDLGIINIELMATRGELAECLPMITRFTTVATLGVLPQGRYEVRTNGNGPAQYLPIAEAPSRGPGEVYADIDRVFVDYAPDREFDSRWMVVLMGRFHTTCEEFDMIRVIDDGKTIEVLPTLRETSDVCAPQMRPFIERRFMPDIADAGRYLLRARTGRGGAINYVFSAFE
jgi:hypothetical protein